MTNKIGVKWNDVKQNGMMENKMGSKEIMKK
jgi:hypothetical protein